MSAGSRLRFAAKQSPDAPQWVTLDWGSMQPSEQSMRGDAHDVSQLLFEHTSPAAHAAPHAPQFAE